ncbi:hypothetical protein J608_6079, partial [Acinetobacter baumannii 1288284]
TFISYGLLAEASTIVHKKAGVQEWVDNGWIDALVLHGRVKLEVRHKPPN